MKLSAAARTPSMFEQQPTQLELKLGFWLEQQRKAAPKPMRSRAGSRRGDEATTPPRSGAAGVDVTFPMRLVNPLNGSQGTSRKAMFGASAIKKKQRAAARMRTAHALQGSYWGESYAFNVLLTRIAPGKFDDDNLRAAFKAIRDGVADALGFKDDSDPRLHWEYAQEKGRRANKKKGVLAQHEVRVHISVRK